MGNDTKEMLTSDIIDVYYLDADKKLQNGKFTVKLPTMGELTDLYKLCQKRNLRTGQVIETDDIQFSKYRVAVAIVDCPLIVEMKSWKDLELKQKTAALEKAFQEDTFFMINRKLKEMDKYPINENAEETANLFAPQ